MKHNKMIWIGLGIVMSLVLVACGGAISDEVTVSIPDTAVPSDQPPATLTPAPTIAEYPADIDDLSIYKEAMRPGHEDAVDRFADAPRYWMDIRLDADPLRITGMQQVMFTNTSSDEIFYVVFRLYPNMLTREGPLAVSEVRVSDREAEYQIMLQDSLMRVILPEALLPGEAVMIEMAFDFALPAEAEIAYGRMVDREGIAAAPTFFPMLSIYDDGAWWDGWADMKGDPVYSEVALFDVLLTAPSTLHLATSGSVVDEQPQPNGTTIYRIVTGPLRDFALAYSRDYELYTTDQDGVRVNIWASFAPDEAANYALEVSAWSVKILDGAFGEYPYAELDIVESPVSALGIEYPGLVYLADRIWEADEGELGLFEWVIVHEIGHQWWYGVVGNNQIDEPWIDEGLAEYSVEVYYREKVGPRAAETVRERYQAEVDQYIEDEGARLPVGLPAESYTAREYRTFVYSGGALVYGLLAQEYGPGQVNQLLQAFYRQYSFKIAHTEDIEQLVEDILGQDALDFFRSWVYEGG